MTNEIRQVDSYFVTVPNQPGAAAHILAELNESGVHLLAFSVQPSQLDFIPEHADAFLNVINKMGVLLNRRTSGFLIWGEDRLGAITRILNQLAHAQIEVISVQAVTAGACRFGTLLWVKPQDVTKAAEELAVNDIVDEASKESFPASDPPSWTLG